MDYLMFAGDVLIHMTILFVCLGIGISALFLAVAIMFWIYDKIKEVIREEKK